MAFNLHKTFCILFDEYNSLLSSGNHYAALSRLAQIYHCIRDDNQELKAKWLSALFNEKLTEEALIAVKADLCKDLQQIKNVLSIGDTWDRDEVLQVLQQRVFIDLIDDFLQEVHQVKLYIQTDEVDALIKSTAKTRNNNQVFISAIKTMKKNWGLSIKSKWLDFSLAQG